MGMSSAGYAGFGAFAQALSDRLKEKRLRRQDLADEADKRNWEMRLEGIRHDNRIAELGKTAELTDERYKNIIHPHQLELANVRAGHLADAETLKYQRSIEEKQAEYLRGLSEDFYKNNMDDARMLRLRERGILPTGYSIISDGAGTGTGTGTGSGSGSGSGSSGASSGVYEVDGETRYGFSSFDKAEAAVAKKVERRTKFLVDLHKSLLSDDLNITEERKNELIEEIRLAEAFLLEDEKRILGKLRKDLTYVPDFNTYDPKLQGLMAKYYEATGMKSAAAAKKAAEMASHLDGERVSPVDPENPRQRMGEGGPQGGLTDVDVPINDQADYYKPILPERVSMRDVLGQGYDLFGNELPGEVAARQREEHPRTGNLLDWAGSFANRNIPVGAENRFTGERFMNPELEEFAGAHEERGTGRFGYYGPNTELVSPRGDVRSHSELSSPMQRAALLANDRYAEEVDPLDPVGPPQPPAGWRRPGGLAEDDPRMAREDRKRRLDAEFRGRRLDEDMARDTSVPSGGPRRGGPRAGGLAEVMEATEPTAEQNATNEKRSENIKKANEMAKAIVESPGTIGFDEIRTSGLPPPVMSWLFDLKIEAGNGILDEDATTMPTLVRESFFYLNP